MIDSCKGMTGASIAVAVGMGTSLVTYHGLSACIRGNCGGLWTVQGWLYNDHRVSLAAYYMVYDPMGLGAKIACFSPVMQFAISFCWSNCEDPLEHPGLVKLNGTSGT